MPQPSHKAVPVRGIMGYDQATSQFVIVKVDADGKFDISGSVQIIGPGIFGSAKVDCASSGNNLIVAAQGEGKCIYVHTMKVIFDGTVNAKFKSADTDLEGAQSFQAREGYVLAQTPPAWLIKTAANEALNLNLSAAIHAGGFVAYFVV